VATFDAAAFDSRDDFQNPPHFDAAEREFATQYSPPRITPIVARLRSVDGDTDGDDVLDGGSETDWLFGGGNADTADGGTDSDYVDGGAGNDRISGGDGDDIARGGANDDLVHGGVESGALQITNQRSCAA
jgi:Ca2+-binding RTX toxin-like protein